MKTKQITKVPTNEGQTLDIYLTYYKESGGGVYYLNCNPVKYENGFTIYSGFSGVRMKIREVKRFSAKELENIKPTVDQLNDCIKYVCNKNNLTIKL